MSKDSGWPKAAGAPEPLEQQVKRVSRAYADYDVGFGKPPSKSQWKKGQSGNPKGRPKKIERSNSDVQKLRDLIRLFHQEVEIVLHGKKTKLTMIECIYSQVATQAAKGNPKFLGKAIELYDETIDLAQRLNPQLARELLGLEQLLGKYDKLDSKTVEYANTVRRKTRRI